VLITFGHLRGILLSYARVPTLYGFSIIVLVLVLMILNHFIYLGILERSIETVENKAHAAALADQAAEVVEEDSQEPETLTEESPDENIEEATEEGI